MSPLITGTASQGSEMWKGVPVTPPISSSLHNCPSLDLPAVAPLPLGIQTTPVGAKIPVPTEGGLVRDLQRAGKPKKTANADSIVDEIHRVVANAGKTPETMPSPTNEAVSKVVSVISTVRDPLLAGADVDTLHGEINLTWSDDAKQVILICRADQDALVHHHQHIKGKSSKHGIEKATANRLAHWLRWLHE